MNSELFEALNALEKEKKISKATMIEAIEGALIKACENHFGKADNFVCKIDPDNGDFSVIAAKEVVETVEDAEWIEDVNHPSSEVITVVFLLQTFNGCLIAYAEVICQFPDRRVKDSEQFVLGDSAQSLVTPVHADVIRLVESTEHAHLREFGDTCQHHKLEVLVDQFEYTV